LPYFRIDRVIPSEDAKSFEKWLVCESFLESSTSILDQSVQYDKGADLAMYIAVLTAKVLDYVGHM
jgi:hypothetical protein